MPHRLFRVAIAVVVAMTSVSARQSTQTPAFRSGVDLIAVDAEVFDKNGKPVEGLSADKFEVKVAGKPRRVVSATFVDYARHNTEVASTLQLPGLQAPPSRAIAPERAGRLFVLVVDCSTFSALEARAVLVATKSFVATLQPNDRIGLLAFPVGPALEPTTDRAVVIKALDDITGQKDNDGGDQFQFRPSELVILANCSVGYPDNCGIATGSPTAGNGLSKKNTFTTSVCADESACVSAMNMEHTRRRGRSPFPRTDDFAPLDQIRAVRNRLRHFLEPPC